VLAVTSTGMNGRIDFTKSPALGAGNVREPWANVRNRESALSRVRVDQCVTVN